MKQDFSLNYHQTKFVLSAPDIKSLPSADGFEVAFLGRSNAGKSTALNMLTNQKNLAKTSKTPGRTQLINLFEVAPDYRITDLPGYGYAAVPEDVKLRWQKSLSEYLYKRSCLIAVVILMDIRHPLKELDQQMTKWAVNSNLPVLILLTKADKISNNERQKQVKIVREAILPFAGDIQVETFSSLQKIGIEKLVNKLNNWYAMASDNIK